jgi:hypothetical protein
MYWITAFHPRLDVTESTAHCQILIPKMYQLKLNLQVSRMILTSRTYYVLSVQLLTEVHVWSSSKVYIQEWKLQSYVVVYLCGIL